MRLSERLRAWEKEGEAIREAIDDAAASMIAAAMEAGTSLRQVSRRIKRSPTYVSNVLNGKMRVSPATYDALAVAFPELEPKAAK